MLELIGSALVGFFLAIIIVYVLIFIPAILGALLVYTSLLILTPVNCVIDKLNRKFFKDYYDQK